MLRQPLSVLVVIYKRDGDFLLIQRADDPEFWQSVTGGIEQGEKPIDTAIRELKEETGIDALKLNLSVVQHSHTNSYEIRPQWRYRYAPGNYINTEYVFSVEVPEHITLVLNPSEHTDYIWLPQRLAAQKAWSPSNKKEIIELEIQTHAI
ncbi:dihydroneopterin triphosphate diphosphatase [Pseudoalteromonas xiamenensis]